MPMNEERSSSPGIVGSPSPMVDGDGAANLAPDLDAVFSWRNAGDVDFRSARALHDVLHASVQPTVLHELNASIPRNQRLEDHKASRRREAFHLGNVQFGRHATSVENGVAQLFRSTGKGFALHDGPAAQQGETTLIEKRKQIGEMFKTVVRQVHQHHLRLASKVFVVLPRTSVLANDGRRRT